MDGATRAHLDSIDAGMAKRWMALAGRPSRHTANPERTHNLPKVKASELPGKQSRLVKDGFKRDFAGMSPSSVARHQPAASKQANEHTPMKEGPVDFMLGSHPHKLGAPSKPTGPVARDLRRAAAQIGR
jgi:hypothetical protein